MPQLDILQLIASQIRDYRQRDRVLAAQAAAILICQLIAWLAFFFVGYALLLWPFVSGGITDAFTTAGPGLWQIGSDGLQRRPGANDPRLRVADRDRHRHPADRLPADPVLGVQPPRDRDRAAQRAGRGPVVGPGTAGPDPLRAGLGGVDHRHPARPLRGSGSAGPPTWRRATPPTCRSSGSARRSRCRHGSPRCSPSSTPPP